MARTPKKAEQVNPLIPFANALGQDIGRIATTLEAIQQKGASGGSTMPMVKTIVLDYVAQNGIAKPFKLVDGAEFDTFSFQTPTEFVGKVVAVYINNHFTKLHTALAESITLEYSSIKLQEGDEFTFVCYGEQVKDMRTIPVPVVTDDNSLEDEWR